MPRSPYRGTPPIDRELAEDVGAFAEDPLGFVLFAYPWGESKGPLAEFPGPDDWQRAFLQDLGVAVKARNFDGLHAVSPIRMAVSSGHGIGKGVLSAWLTDWILSTRPHSQGTVTANTFPQLTTKTWATILKWTRWCITSHWFDLTHDRIRSRTHPDSWFVSAQTCREENSESFAGQHAATSTSWYLFDEASAIPDGIWEVAEGGLTDGEPMIFAWGNPTRNSGKFHRVCFGSERGRWEARVIDSRLCRFTNKDLINEWIEDHGEDSDFVRVRVRGLAPRASDQQFIDAERVYEAQHRPAPVVLDDEPLLCGLDVARGGDDSCVFRFRRGLDGASVKPIKLSGEAARDSMRLVSTAADVLSETYHGRRVAVLFVDETGIGGPIVDRLRQMGHRNVLGIQFGAKSSDAHCENMRAFIWSQMREWLTRGVIDRDVQLEMDLCGPGYGHNKRDKLVLEPKESMKKRGLASPDDADALALTFAHHIGPQVKEEPAVAGRYRDYDPDAARGSWMQ